MVALFSLLLLSPARTWAQNPDETQAFGAAARAFEDRAYQRAEREFGEFVQKFPTSERVPEAVLVQAEARYFLGRHDAAIELLNSRLAQAGKLADQYRFWIAEAQFAHGDYTAASASYAQLLKDFPASNQQLAASYGQAHARFKLGDLPATIDLLRQPQGAFQQAAQARPNDELVTRGQLLLAEALFAQKDHRAAEETLSALANRPLAPDLNWRRQYLLARAMQAQQKLDVALQTVTNLVTLSTNAPLQAESTALHGEILQQLNQPDAAILVFEKNLAESVPAERRRQALLKVIELSLAQNQLTGAVQRLEAFLKLHPQDPALDLVHLSLGELRLKEYYALKQAAEKSGTAPDLAAQTNLLQQAQAQLDQLLSAHPQSPLVGKAHLNRGWCLWEQQKSPEAMVAFKEATDRLPPSEDQALARFKWAECQFLQKDYAAAVKNFRAVTELASAVPQLKTNLVDQALYQIARASVEAADLAGAREAMQRLLTEYPQHALSERSALLVGQALSQSGQPAEARKLFADFAAKFPNSALLPEALLATARTYAFEKNWGEAIGQYDGWIDRFTNHVALARAEFDRAWLHDQAGQATNALRLFTNFVARFLTNELAPQAQYWVGSYHFDRGDFPAAELNFQLLYQNTNWPPSELSFQARMMAGRAAVARQGIKDARDYLYAVITNGPPSLVPEALLLLGDTFVEEAPTLSTNLLNETYGAAINAFVRITNNFPTHPLALLAIGRIGDCHFNLAAQYPERYASAAENYQKVADSAAGVATRSLAKVGLGRVLEVQARTNKLASEQAPRLEAALDHYRDVVYGKNLRAGETPDAFVVKEAGLLAARVLETQHRWEEATKLYRRLQAVLPPLRDTLEKKIAQARAQAEAAKP